MALDILKGEKVQAHLWAKIVDIESSALTQIKNVCKLPWVFHHAAIMADVHAGIGCTIGSVIASKNSICPSLVGVDIGCFAKETNIPLLDGKSYDIKDLVGRNDVYVWATDEKHRIVASKAEALLTRKNADLVRVTLDNGEKIRCTPDQKFRLRNGDYCEAKDLKPNDSLMPFNSRLDKDEYTIVQQPYLGTWQRAHWVMARSGLLGEIPSFDGQKTIIHHKNFNESDNRPENLQFMGDRDHSSYHRNLVENNEHWQSEDFEKKRKAALAAKAATVEGHEYFHQKWEKNLSTYWDGKEDLHKELTKNNGQRGKKYLIDYNQSDEGREKSKEWNEKFKCDICGEIIKSPIGYYQNHRPKCVLKNNHKVISVECLSEKEDVYCLKVPEYHNFALSAGVFVHNCGMSAIKTNLTANHLPDDLSKLRHSIERGIPVGFNAHDKPLKAVERLPLWKEFGNLSEKVQSLKSKALKQCGSLGGGNHFIELCLDTENNVWIMLHSGSRNLGKTIAEIHIDAAKKLTHNIILEDRDLASFLAGTPEMQAYRNDLYFAQRYALANRTAMLDVYKDQLTRAFPQITYENEIKCHHNYVSEEIHYGEKVFVTRKGAINASKGVLGIIPGCLAAGTRVLMSDGSYKNIETILAGDKIISGTGEPTTVINTFKRGQKLVWKYKNNNFWLSTSVTPDHEHFIGNLSSANYQTQGRVKVIDSLTRQGKSKYEWCKLQNFSDSITLLFPRNITFQIPDSFSIQIETSNGTRIEKGHKGLASLINKQLLVSSYATGYVFGTFLGDGTAGYTRAKGGQVAWSFGIEEDDIAQKLSQTLKEVFNIPCKIYKYHRKSIILVVVHNANLGKLFLDFGKKQNKALPTKYWVKHPEYLRGLYDGMIDSDGHINNNTLKFTNTSTVCVEQFGIIHYLLFGYLPSVGVREPSVGGLKNCNLENCNPSYRSTSLRLPPLAENHQCVEMLDLVKSNDLVETFDIEVNSPDHSFTANNAIVHNSMGAESYIVEGKGNTESFESAPHGAGRKMSRGEAKRRFTQEDLAEQTAGVECRKDAGVIDEIPGAYKDIRDVIANSEELVTVKAKLKQIMCIKG